MKHRLTIDFESQEKITTWDIGANAGEMLPLALEDIGEVLSFKLERLDGPSLEEAFENCQPVSSSEDDETWT